jgi:NAD-dependent dihydropyrimidine dehydrogenase PreA subunit
MEQATRKGNEATENPGSVKRAPTKNRAKPVQNYRFAIQSAFALLCIWIGIEFHFFVKDLETDGASGSLHRPPGVEGFLPISALISLYNWVLGNGIHAIHPAGFFILTAIIVLSIVFGKAFCSWLCPVGFVSELLGDLGQKVFGRTLIPPRWLDAILRSLKYLLLGFFVYSIFFLMTSAAVQSFLDSPYNRVADIRMYYFFAGISRFSLIVVGVLALLSVVIRHFWCRYLCPYGALLGITSLISPNKIRRNVESCIDCAKCAKICPSRIKVDKLKTVWSDECTTCMQCIDVCPIAKTLELRSAVTRQAVPGKVVAAGVVLLFVAITGLGMLTGHWKNRISTKEYLYHESHLMDYGHPTGADDISTLNREAESGH